MKLFGSQDWNFICKLRLQRTLLSGVFSTSLFRLPFSCQNMDSPAQLEVKETEEGMFCNEEGINLPGHHGHHGQHHGGGRDYEGREHHGHGHHGEHHGEHHGGDRDHESEHHGHGHHRNGHSGKDKHRGNGDGETEDLEAEDQTKPKVSDK